MPLYFCGKGIKKFLDYKIFSADIFVKSIELTYFCIIPLVLSPCLERHLDKNMKFM